MQPNLSIKQIFQFYIPSLELIILHLPVENYICHVLV